MTTDREREIRAMTKAGLVEELVGAEIEVAIFKTKCYDHERDLEQVADDYRRLTRELREVREDAREIALAHDRFEDAISTREFAERRYYAARERLADLVDDPETESAEGGIGRMMLNGADDHWTARWVPDGD